MNFSVQRTSANLSKMLIDIYGKMCAP